MITLFGNYGHIIEVNQDTFPDGTLHISLPDEDIRAVEWNYESDAELFTLICIRKHYADCDMRLILPYIPHARMDRVKEPTDVFTLKYFCQIINDLNFDEVWVLDAHSNVSLALLDRVTPIPVTGCIKEAIERTHVDKEDLILFFPDEGAMKRYSSESNLPYAFGMKKRDWATGKIQGLQLINEELVKGKNVLIVDDICSRGGTFLHSARALKTAGAKDIYLYVTHAEHTMVDGEMYNDLDLVKKIITTDTIFQQRWDDRNKVDIIQNY